MLEGINLPTGLSITPGSVVEPRPDPALAVLFGPVSDRARQPMRRPRPRRRPCSPAGHRSGGLGSSRRNPVVAAALTEWLDADDRRDLVERLAEGLGQPPTPEEQEALVTWASRVRAQAGLLEATLDGGIAVVIRNGQVAFRSWAIPAEVA